MLPWYYTIDMDENTIFGQGQVNQQPPGAVFPNQPQESQPVPVSNQPPLTFPQPLANDPSNMGGPGFVPPPVPPVPSAPSAPPTAPQTSEPENNQSSQGSPLTLFKTILKVLLGLIVIGGIFLLFYVFVLPRFVGNKNEKVTITYWGLWEDQRVYQSVISDFQKQNPNITINFVKQDGKKYRERLDTRINNGTGPDVFRFHNTWISMLYSFLAPIPSDIISAKDFKSSFYPVAQNDLIRNGAIFGIPLEIDTLALYVNTDKFQAAGIKPPVTWEEFINDARLMTVKDEKGKIITSGVAIGTYANVAHAPDIISLLFAQNGVNPYDISANPQKAAETLDFYTAFAIGDGNVWDSTQDSSTLAFAKGNVGMYFGYSWDYFNIKAINPDLKFKVIAVPQLPDQKKNIASYWVEGVSTKSKHQKEAMQFLKFLTSKESVEKIFTETSKTRDYGEPYARMDLADSVKDNPNVYPFILQAESAVSSLFVDGTNDDGINSKLNTYLENAVNSVVDNGSSETAVQTLSKGVTQVLSEYGQ
jgi:ABC-type glycerol-3-phosphate transport system substrate-binding protein